MDPTVYTDPNGQALQGHDPVAYFTVGEPTKGSPNISREWNGATWLFASAANRELFDASPAKYAPAFGGHCAVAQAFGADLPGSANRWRIEDGRLYVNKNLLAAALFGPLSSRISRLDSSPNNAMEKSTAEPQIRETGIRTTIANRANDRLLKTINAGHKTVIKISGGRLGATAANMAVVKLTTTGRVSGRPRTVMLTTPIQENGRYIIVASKGGDDRDPDWYRNLQANPKVSLEPVGSNSPIVLKARTATTEERAELWPRIAIGDKGYAAYERKTDRNIPVVICEPPD